MNFVSTRTGKCKKCYSCIRHCPVKAIRVKDDQSFVIEDRCINCGNCLSYCSQNAKKVESFIDQVKSWLRDNIKVTAILAPSYSCIPQSDLIPGLLKRKGFQFVEDASFGAEMIVSSIIKDIETSKIFPRISSPCPAVVELVRKHFPELIPNLISVVSPLIAVARKIKMNKPDTKTVFFGPCVAKMTEVWVENSGIDAVCTFSELEDILKDVNKENISISGADFEGGLTQLFPVSGGLLESTLKTKKFISRDVIVVDGPEETVKVLQALKDKEINVKMIDILFCKGGCINGPAFFDEDSLYLRRERMLSKFETFSEEKKDKIIKEAEKASELVNLTRNFQKAPINWSVPVEQEIRKILNQIGIHDKTEELNCGACGYPSCRENAVAIHNNIAEKGMCLHYLMRQLQNFNDEIVQSEKMSALGQLASGIAHEINNPLGLISAYSQYLKKGNISNTHKQYITIIEDEIDRIAKLIRNFLRLSRKNSEKFQNVDVSKLIRNILIVIEPTLKDNNIQLKTSIEDKPIWVSGDENLLSQVFTNMILNAHQAISDEGIIDIFVRVRNNEAMIEIKDNGQGISPEIQARIFEPFFTTKEPGKGTGLGLFIVYETVKRHGGNISVYSDPGQKTVFTVILPLIKNGDNK